MKAPVVRIFISSPGDVADERKGARKVVEQLQKRYAGRLVLKPLFWEDLPLSSRMTFQQGIDAIVSSEGVDIAVFVLWSRFGTPAGSQILRKDGTEYQSGTQREWDLMAELHAECGRPQTVLLYVRKDKPGFDEKLRNEPTEQQGEMVKQRKLVEGFIETISHNKTAFHEYTTVAEFTGRLRLHLEALIDQLTEFELAAPVWNVLEKGSPFVGLEAFQFEHAPVFFGREDEIVKVWQLLAEQAMRGCPFVLIAGASGSGKSSLARAGVLPAIVDSDEAGWRHAAFTPADGAGNLLRPLARALMKASPRDRGEESEEVARLMEYLADSPKMLSELGLRPILEGNGQHRRLILLVDQLEELFTDQHVTDAMREQFVGALEQLARSGLVWVLATVRSDYYAEFQSLGALVRMKDGSGQFDLLPPTLDALQRLIREPARMAGLRFEKRGSLCLDELMLRDAAQHAELLPLVQFVLKKLYERRVPAGIESCPADGANATELATGDCVLSWAVYEELGGVEGALARTAEEAIARLQPSEATLDALLVELVAGDGDNRDSFVRRRAARADLERDETMSKLVASLVHERLLTGSSQSAGPPFVMVAHEALLRVWPYARGWVERNQEFIRLRDSTTSFYERWRVSEGEEKEKRLLPPGPACAEGQRLLELGAGRRLQPELRDFIRRSLETVEENICRALLRAGDRKAASQYWARPAPEFAAVRGRVLADVFARGNIDERRNAAFLAGEIQERKSVPDLTRLLLQDGDDAVRRAAAYSLLRLQDVAPWPEVAAAEGTGGQSALAYLLVAADMQTKDASRFYAWYRTLPLDLRWRVRTLSWAFRFRSAIPVFFAVVIPAIILCIFAAMAVKFLPGLLNYAYGQARPSATMGLFHGAVAAIFVGGAATFGLALYRMVFGREYVPCDYLRPVGAICFGAIFGAFGGFLCNVAIAGVFVPEALKIMGWLPLEQREPPGLLEFFHQLYFHNLCGWVFTLNGAGVGIGMALITNRLRFHRRWQAFLRLKARTAMSTFRQAITVLGGLFALTSRYIFVMAAVLFLTSLAGLAALAATGGMQPEGSPTWRQTLTGGLPGAASNGAEGATDEEVTARLRAWKTSRFGRVVGITFDSTAKALGGYFAVVGMGFGIVLLRSGINIERRQRVG